MGRIVLVMSFAAYGAHDDSAAWRLGVQLAVLEARVLLQVVVTLVTLVSSTCSEAAAAFDSCGRRLHRYRHEAAAAVRRCGGSRRHFAHNSSNHHKLHVSQHYCAPTSIIFKMASTAVRVALLAAGVAMVAGRNEVGPVDGYTRFLRTRYAMTTLSIQLLL